MHIYTAGWHPKRFEFEPEWDNDAETSIADLEFREEDSPQEVAAKLRLLEIYNLRLDEVGGAFFQG
jgi:transcriptional adapter 2-alpha